MYVKMKHNINIESSSEYDFNEYNVNESLPE